MDKQLGESLSALMDGEASELDLERVLKHSDDEAVRNTWAQFHSARDSLQPGASVHTGGVDLSLRIRAAIEAEPSAYRGEEPSAYRGEEPSAYRGKEPSAYRGREPSASPGKEPPRAQAEAYPHQRPIGRLYQFVRPAASFAVAASVFAAVLVGSQFYGLLGNGSGPDAAAPALADRVSTVGIVNGLGGSAVRAAYDSPPIRIDNSTVSDYDELARQRLQRYMLPHTEETALNASQGMMPYARVATFEIEE